LRRTLACAVLTAVALTGCGLFDPGVDREAWLAAGPREPGASAERDRCDIDLRDWFEAQLVEGMTPGQVETAVGQPDTMDNDVWQWDLGFCGFGVDYEWYEVTFEGGRLAEVQFVQG
jgi:hypothetical protein